MDQQLGHSNGSKLFNLILQSPTKTSNNLYGNRWLPANKTIKMLNNKYHPKQQFICHPHDWPETRQFNQVQKYTAPNSPARNLPTANISKTRNLSQNHLNIKENKSQEHQIKLTTVPPRPAHDAGITNATDSKRIFPRNHAHEHTYKINRKNFPTSPRATIQTTTLLDSCTPRPISGT